MAKYISNKLNYYDNNIHDLIDCHNMCILYPNISDDIKLIFENETYDMKEGYKKFAGYKYYINKIPNKSGIFKYYFKVNGKRECNKSQPILIDTDGQEINYLITKQIYAYNIYYTGIYEYDISIYEYDKEYIIHAAKLGDLHALYILGFTSNNIQMTYYLSIANKLDNGYALYLWGYILYLETDEMGELKNVENMWLESTKRGYKRALRHLMHIYATDKCEYNIECIKTAIKNNIKEAFYIYGKYYKMQNDIENMIKYYKIAASHGSLLAIYKLAKYYKDKDFKLSLAYCELGRNNSCIECNQLYIDLTLC